MTCQQKLLTGHFLFKQFVVIIYAMSKRFKIILLITFGIFFVFTKSALANPPTITDLNHSFDNNNDPQIMTITGAAEGATEQVLCQVQVDSQQTFVYGIERIVYEALN